MKFITFSRTFPAYHPKAGEPTYFVEKILESQDIAPVGVDAFQYIENLNPQHDISIYEDFVREMVIGGHDPKFHTIRAGHRWKEGDWFSPHVWSGKPYNSKHIKFAPDIQIKKVWDFKLIRHFDGVSYSYAKTINGNYFYLNELALEQNDGLSDEDFNDWFVLSPEFKKEGKFSGQIICWNESINY